MWSMEKKPPNILLANQFRKKDPMKLQGYTVIHIICQISANYRSLSRMDFVIFRGIPYSTTMYILGRPREVLEHSAHNQMKQYQ